MILKVAFTLIVFIICLIIYCFFKNKEHSLAVIIVTGVMSTIIGSILIPSNISWYDISYYIKEEIIGNKNEEKVQVNNKTQESNNSKKDDNSILDSVDNKNDNKSKHTHKKFETKKENIIKSKCNKKGSYNSVTYCKCGKELKRKNIVTKALRHKYKKGICIRCKHKDPNYVKVYNSKEIMKILSKSIVSSGSSYAEYFGSDSISVFAKDKHNCFSINTAVSYNLWGGNVQTIKFNISDLNKFNKLNLNIGGETQSNGSMMAEFFIDKSFNKKATKIHNFDASSAPQKLSINIKNATSLGIRLTNKSNNFNNIVFFGFSVA